MKVIQRFTGPGLVLVPSNIVPAQLGIWDMDFIPVALPAGMVIEIIVREARPQDNPNRN